MIDLAIALEMLRRCIQDQDVPIGLYWYGRNWDGDPEYKLEALSHKELKIMKHLG